MATEINSILPSETAIVNKGLSFTKKTYESLITNVMELTRVAKKNRWEKTDVAGLYGIFYASVAGIIRSGALASRSTGIDGFPEIRVMAGNKEYHCRESALYGILGQETENLLVPYEDTHASYVGERPFHILSAPITVPIVSEEDTESIEKVQTKKRAKKEMTANEVRSEYEKRLQSLRETQKLQMGKLQAALDASKKELYETRQSLTEANNQILSFPAMDQDCVQQLKEENNSLKEEIQTLKQQLDSSTSSSNVEISEELDKAKQQIVELKAQLEQIPQGKKAGKDLSNQLSVTKQEAKALRTELSELQEQKKQSEEILSTTQEELSSAKESNLALHKENEILQQRVRELEQLSTASSGDESEQIRTLLSESEKQRSKIKELQKEKEDLAKNAASMQHKMIEAEQARDKALFSVSEDESETVKSLRSLLKEEEQKNQTLEQKYNELQRQSLDTEEKVYSEMLPDLIRSLDTSRSDFLVRFVLLMISMAGIVGSLVFLV